MEVRVDRFRSDCMTGASFAGSALKKLWFIVVHVTLAHTAFQSGGHSLVLSAETSFVRFSPPNKKG